MEKSNYEFLMQVAGDNKSAYINNLLREMKELALEESIAKANEEEVSDSYQKELSEWDVTMDDGIL